MYEKPFMYERRFFSYQSPNCDKRYHQTVTAHLQTVIKISPKRWSHRHHTEVCSHRNGDPHIDHRSVIADHHFGRVIYSHRLVIER